jgi:hypothetical protein
MKVLISAREKVDIELNSEDFLTPYPTISVTWLGPTPFHLTVRFPLLLDKPRVEVRDGLR